MEIVKATENLNREDLDKVIRILEIGGIIAYPTDT